MKHRHMKFRSTAPLILLSVLFILICFFPERSPALIGIKEGDTPKEIVLDDLNGRPVNVAGHFGKSPVILVFWKLTDKNSFLDYSMDELRMLQDTYERLHDKAGLNIFAIYTPKEFNGITDKEMSTVRNLVNTNGITFPVLIDIGYKSFREYGVIALPSTIMISETGKIEFIYSSFPMSAKAIISNNINKLVGIAGDMEKDKIVQKKKADTRADRLYNYALKMSKRGLHEQAISALKKSMDLARDDTWSYNLMGIILWEKRMYEQSIEEFRKAMRADRNNIAARLNYASLLIEKEDYKEAEQILKIPPAAAEGLKVRAHHLLGIISMNTNITDRAIKEFETAYELIKGRLSDTKDLSPYYYSTEISVLHGLSELYCKRGDHEKAFEILNTAFSASLGLGGSFARDQRAGRHDIMIYE